MVNGGMVLGAVVAPIVGTFVVLALSDNGANGIVNPLVSTCWIPRFYLSFPLILYC